MVRKTSSRRRFLQSSAGIGVIGIAGCIGDDDPAPDPDDDPAPDPDDDPDDDDEPAPDPDPETEVMRIGASTRGSTVFETSQAIQRVLNDESDIVNWDTQTTGGDPPAVRYYNDGELEAYGVANWTVEQAIGGTGPFEAEEPGELDIPYQGFGYFVRDDFWVKREGLDDLEDTDDLLTGDWNVYILQPGWSTRVMLLEILGEDPEIREILEENAVNIDTADVAGALEEDRIDALVGYGNNEVNLPAWLREAEARNELEYLPIGPRFADAIEQSPLSPLYEKDSYGFEQDIGSDIFEGWQILFQYFISPDVSAEAVYEVLRVCYESTDRIREGMPAVLPYNEDPSHFVATLQDDFVPVHPGAAEFYQEHGVWDDNWEVGD